MTGLIFRVTETVVNEDRPRDVFRAFDDVTDAGETRGGTDDDDDCNDRGVVVETAIGFMGLFANLAASFRAPQLSPPELLALVVASFVVTVAEVVRVGCWGFTSDVGGVIFSRVALLAAAVDELKSTFDDAVMKALDPGTKPNPAPDPSFVGGKSPYKSIVKMLCDTSPISTASGPFPLAEI